MRAASVAEREPPARCFLCPGTDNHTPGGGGDAEAPSRAEEANVAAQRHTPPASAAAGPYLQHENVDVMSSTLLTHDDSAH